MGLKTVPTISLRLQLPGVHSFRSKFPDLSTEPSQDPPPAAFNAFGIFTKAEYRFPSFEYFIFNSQKCESPLCLLINQLYNRPSKADLNFDFQQPS